MGRNGPGASPRMTRPIVRSSVGASWRGLPDGATVGADLQDPELEVDPMHLAPPVADPRDVAAVGRPGVRADLASRVNDLVRLAAAAPARARCRRRSRTVRARGTSGRRPNARRATFEAGRRRPGPCVSCRTSLPSDADPPDLARRAVGDDPDAVDLVPDRDRVRAGRAGRGGIGGHEDERQPVRRRRCPRHALGRLGERPVAACVDVDDVQHAGGARRRGGRPGSHIGSRRAVGDGARLGGRRPVEVDHRRPATRSRRRPRRAG